MTKFPAAFSIHPAEILLTEFMELMGLSNEEEAWISNLFVNPRMETAAQTAA